MTNVPYQDVSKPNYADPMNAQPAPMNSQQPTVMFSQPVLQPFYQPPMAQPGIVYQQQQPILVPNGVPNGMNFTSPPPKVKCTPGAACCIVEIIILVLLVVVGIPLSIVLLVQHYLKKY